MCSQGVRHAAPRPNFNGATLPPDKEDSFHPNADGQKARGINTVRPAVVTRRPVAAGSSAPWSLRYRKPQQLVDLSRHVGNESLLRLGAQT
jgi:hypothetical protein